MNESTFIQTVNGYTVRLELVDYGERLQDYEGFWKWFLFIQHKKQEGPERGYYGTIEEAIEEAVDQLWTYPELQIEEEDFIEELKRACLARFKR